MLVVCDYLNNMNNRATRIEHCRESYKYQFSQNSLCRDEYCFYINKLQKKPTTNLLDQEQESVSIGRCEIWFVNPLGLFG